MEFKRCLLKSVVRFLLPRFVSNEASQQFDLFYISALCSFILLHTEILVFAIMFAEVVTVISGAVVVATQHKSELQ